MAYDCQQNLHKRTHPWSLGHNLSNLLDDWFPLQLAHDGDDYIGPDYESITYDDGRWIFPEFGVDTLSCFDTFSSEKQTLLCAAELVRRDWALHGWRFVGPSRDEQLQEVLQRYPRGWERAVGIFPRPCHWTLFQTSEFRRVW